jgi:hypothetical protein
LKSPADGVTVEAYPIRKEARMPQRALIGRIRAEFQEMPGLRLTLLQAQRLCGGDRAAIEAALRLLVDEDFLCVRHGHYARPSEVRSVDREVEHDGHQHVHRTTR